MPILDYTRKVYNVSVFCYLNTMLSIYYQDKEKSFRQQMDDLEEAGYCTMCIRKLYPHQRSEECDLSMATFPNSINWPEARFKV